MVTASTGAESRVEPEVRCYLPRERLDAFLAALAADGRRVVGPVVRDGAIVMADVESADALPIGLTIVSTPGRVSLKALADGPGQRRAFQYAVSGDGIKRSTFPSRVDALSTEIEPDGTVRVRIQAPLDDPPVAILGARACDLAGLAVHDQVLAGGPVVDPDYAARRAGLLVVAVECAVATSTCFCTAVGTGPEVSTGADLILNELDDGYVVRAPTSAGEQIIASLALEPAHPTATAAATAEVAATRASMQADAIPAHARDVLLANLTHPRWDEIAERCVSCANCTLVCPTCFCTGVSITSDMEGRASTSARMWDSCFTDGFAQVGRWQLPTEAEGSLPAVDDPQVRDLVGPVRDVRLRRLWSLHRVVPGRHRYSPRAERHRGDLRTTRLGADPPAADCTAGSAAATQSVAARSGQAGPEAPVVPRVVPASRALPVLEFATATVVSILQETADTTTLRLTTSDPALLAGRPGQFVMVARPAFAIPPISISRYHPDGLELTIRAAGAATSFLTRLRTGATLGLRGPLGRPWPVKDAIGRDVVIVAGGIGLAPLRPVIDAILRERDKYADVRLYIGARTPRDRLFADEIDALARRDDVLVRVTVDRAGPEWLGRVGIVTQLFRSVAGTGSDATAFICGPERMMSATADALADLGVPRDHLWLTLERRMECGVGLCGHCQIGSRFVCRDGPVFSVAEMGDDLRIEGL